MYPKYITVVALMIAQALTGSVISLLTLSSALIGNSLSPTDYLVSLPITATVLGSALMIFNVSQLIKDYGNGIAFRIGSGIGIIGALIACIAIYYQSFIFFCIATFMLGGATVFYQYYRFAGAEIFDNEVSQKRCTALIVGGGIIGAISGPLIATKTMNLASSYPFLGTFIVVILLFVCALFCQLFIYLPKIPISVENQKNSVNDDIKKTLLSFDFIIGTLSCTLGFSMMILIMNALPFAMHNQHYDIQDSALVLQGHFFAMYAPALILMFVVHKIKAFVIIQCGIIFFILGAFFSYLPNHFMGYMTTLVFAGIGWSLLFTAGTLLINRISYPSIKHKIQGISSAMTYLANVLASLAVGFLMNKTNGWLIINGIVAIIMGIFGFYLLCYFYKNKVIKISKI